MPDFDKLHTAAKKLAALTEPGKRQPGLTTWVGAVFSLWQEIADQWPRGEPDDEEAG